MGSVTLPLCLVLTFVFFFTLDWPSITEGPLQTQETTLATLPSLQSSVPLFISPLMDPQCKKKATRNPRDTPTSSLARFSLLRSIALDRPSVEEIHGGRRRRPRQLSNLLPGPHLRVLRVPFAFRHLQDLGEQPQRLQRAQLVLIFTRVT